MAIMQGVFDDSDDSGIDVRSRHQSEESEEWNGDLSHVERYGSRVKVDKKKDKFPEHTQFDFVHIDNTTNLIKDMECLVERIHRSLKPGCYLEIENFFLETDSMHPEDDALQFFFSIIPNDSSSLDRNLQGYNIILRIMGFENLEGVSSRGPSNAEFFERRLEQIMQEVEGNDCLGVQSVFDCFQARKCLGNPPNNWLFNRTITRGRKAP
ncbi:methyltransferase domain-containing protein [Colletotrichum truncatum]|uniref:Methyltransferase domain-containing protein n=1 Tax=Colletotrichum truncatum TaxID=5467 RepID=A0ACC3YC60_COLTU